ncbi:hypothetical protein MNBD_NITROSPIRAE01-1228 [hydrothermal vent metagenome]|uniref:Uncharacterized protein n=1 Tax=hydrothermal vent metagenome TaxID=652676 RepID=A0A3B1D3J5_9ZZZZ
MSFMLSGCLYSDVTLPLTHNFNNTKIGAKRIVLDERSVSSRLVGADISVAWSEDLILQEAKNAGIHDLSFAERRILSVLFGTYMHHELIIYGD